MVNVSIRAHSHSTEAAGREKLCVFFYFVIQGLFHLHLSSVIISASKRDVRLTAAPSWLAWQAARIHLRHERAPCLRNWIHKVKALFRKRETKQRETCGFGLRQTRRM